ncbi:CGLAU_01105 family protein [uncultured Corynebacterium sp.]|uniref:CGLAU_01105 family protein n=1 Tax=uncultured Corynebacterium sp. TaxID=159447 RepID=UPI002594FFC4|nr:CGLAU_01105 family protein [uncultured Corynebacterium sp.]
MTSDYTPHNDITGNFDENAADAPKADFHDEGGSLMDSLKSAGEAWLLAGSALGNVVSHFAQNFREDRSPEAPQGAHALGDTADSHDTLTEQFKAAINNARSSFNSADNDRDFRAAASSFATDAEGILRDLTGSLSRAGDATVKSPHTEDAKAAFGDALSEVREAFNQAVAGVRNRAEESDIDAEGTVNDLRSRLEGLIGKVTEQFDKPKAQDANGDVVDGEVVAEDDK